MEAIHGVEVRVQGEATSYGENHTGVPLLRAGIADWGPHAEAVEKVVLLQMHKDGHQPVDDLEADFQAFVRLDRLRDMVEALEALAKKTESKLP